MKEDVYDRITNRIVASLEAGVRPWLKPWNAEHAAGKITRPLRHNGQLAYSSPRLCWLPCVLLLALLSYAIVSIGAVGQIS